MRARIFVAADSVTVTIDLSVPMASAVKHPRPCDTKGAGKRWKDRAVRDKSH